MLVFNCSHTRHVSTSDEMNLAFEDRVVEIKMIWGNTLQAKHIQVDTDSVRWLDIDSNQNHSAPRSNINKISVIDRKKGAWYGFQGILYAGSCLGIIGAIEGGLSTNPLHTPGEIFGGFTLLGGFYGFIVGVPVGAFVGYKDVYIITEINPQHDIRANRL